MALGKSLSRIDAVAQALEGAPAFAAHAESIRGAGESLRPLAARILEQCVDSPPAHLRDGGLFRDGFDAELDECRLLRRDGTSWLAAYQQRKREELTHPVLGQKVPIGRLPFLQARILARHLRGDLESYVPCVPKG